MANELRTVKDFFDHEYRDYALYVVENRAIPSVIDGLKPSQRKIIHAANMIWKTGKEKPQKLFQLAGSVAAKTFYHHGNCVDGKTKVVLKDGSLISLDEWYFNELGPLEVRCLNEETGEITSELSSPPFKGKVSNYEIKIEFENGEILKCTLDHPILLKDGTWIEAQYLTVNHEIADGFMYHHDKKISHDDI